MSDKLSADSSCATGRWRRRNGFPLEGMKGPKCFNNCIDFYSDSSRPEGLVPLGCDVPGLDGFEIHL
jgi:hypothetical protein